MGGVVKLVRLRDPCVYSSVLETVGPERQARLEHKIAMSMDTLGWAFGMAFEGSDGRRKLNQMDQWIECCYDG